MLDDTRAIAEVDTLTVDGGTAVGAPTPMPRYQLEDHLGSACLEVDGAAAIIAYEEYYAYGATAYESRASGYEVPARRYRYTGQERDEESGLQRHGVRYYAPWLGRWTSADPAGMVDGTNRFEYVGASPLSLLDSRGTNAQWHANAAAFQREANDVVNTVTTSLERIPRVTARIDELVAELGASRRGAAATELNALRREFRLLRDAVLAETVGQRIADLTARGQQLASTAPRGAFSGRGQGPGSFQSAQQALAEVAQSRERARAALNAALEDVEHGWPRQILLPDDYHQRPLEPVRRGAAVNPPAPPTQPPSQPPSPPTTGSSGSAGGNTGQGGGSGTLSRIASRLRRTQQAVSVGLRGAARSGVRLLGTAVRTVVGPIAAVVDVWRTARLLEEGGTLIGRPQQDVPAGTRVSERLGWSHDAPVRTGPLVRESNGRLYVHYDDGG